MILTKNERQSDGIRLEWNENVYSSLQNMFTHF